MITRHGDITCAIAQIQTCSGLRADKCSGLHWVTKPPTWLTWYVSSGSMGYRICGTLQQLVYRQKIKDVDHLKRVLDSWWDTISQELMNGAIDQWSEQLLSVLHSQGGRIEHCLCQCSDTCLLQTSLHCALAAVQCIVIGPVCGCGCLWVCGWVCCHDNSKLHASILTKLGL